MTSNGLKKQVLDSFMQFLLLHLQTVRTERQTVIITARGNGGHPSSVLPSILGVSPTPHSACACFSVPFNALGRQ